ncbi:uncharacterized protein PV09_03273 [Verruconis gallopava]|uniref:NADH-ubiquinone oxidoreductase 29.9 kDa subunit, mitochondrial n=1 Tax=Verruconis gallopava TaxID=253628 RepID=A0A0D2AHR7_9PEZI|nr:uncharacterized protein PV09_03273 [Verruconis gallopava]KIW06105.1 hypothetical protein PV09_03273 [Verruconis gallopava]
MRPAIRLLAAVSKRLEPGSPTGLAGLTTHGAPRSALIFLYTSTLRKLQQIPEHSVYRQATEALTKQRLSIIESVKPAGYDSWLEKVQWQIHNRGESYRKNFGLENEGEAVGAFAYTRFKDPENLKPTSGDHAGEIPDAMKDEVPDSIVEIEPEPQMTLEQVQEIEEKIGAGLLEEVIQVAEGEMRLVDKMIASKVWEPLEEQAPEGQWSYFERGAH